MQIRDLIKDKQPRIYKKLKKMATNKEEKLSHKDYENLMQHSYYRRSSTGAIRQVK